MTLPCSIHENRGNADEMRGGDSTGLRAYNERLVITAIRQSGALSKAAGLDVSEMFSLHDTPDAEAIFDVWLQRAVEALSRAVVSAMSVVDFEEVVIDGMLRPDWRQRVVDGVTSAYGRFDCTGLSPIEIATGSIGPPARVLGAALLPLIGRFSPDTDLLVKTARIPKSGDRKLAVAPHMSKTSETAEETA